jgi:signal-transduction protein with cAMP-binding, CBS, and nucleotidyltransferase domain
MKAIPIDHYPQEMANAFINGITFVNDVRAVDESQLAILMKNAFFAELERGEIIIKAGNTGRRYSFLLRGQLSVYADGDTTSAPINKITPGQNFGGLSIICNTARTATVAVSADCKSALLLSIELTELGNLNDFSTYSLQTKLALYKAIVNNTRWQLELYKMDYPAHPITLRGQRIDIYIGKKNTMEELESLDIQAHQLMEMLVEWNQTLLEEQEISAMESGTWL